MIPKHACLPFWRYSSKYRYATPALMMLFATGVFFANQAQAQPLSPNASKVAVAVQEPVDVVPQIYVAQVSPDYTPAALSASGNLAQATPSKVAVTEQQSGQQRQQLTDDEAHEEQPKNHAAPLVVTAQGHQTRTNAVTKPAVEEAIPGLEAAKVPPPPPGADPDSPPVYVSGEHIDGHADGLVTVTGRGQLIRDMTVVQGEELTYNRQTEVATACQDVRINHNGNVFRGTRAELHVPTYQGHFDEATYQVRLTGAHGQSSQIEFTGKDQMTLHDATYTLCDAKADGEYDWVMTADSVELDFEKDEGVARNAVMRFMGVPILATPWMSFPLSDKRRSGWLVPTFDIDSDNGFTYEQPYYWNIAPNYDATLTPFVMSKRGVGLNTEFRYLEPNYAGTFTGLFLPNDRLRSDGVSISPDQFTQWMERDPQFLAGLLTTPRNRWGYSWQHRQILTRNMSLLGTTDLQLDLNRASDDNYWRDFPRAPSGSLSTRLLNSEGILRSNNGGVSTLVRVQRWQVLQDLDSYITPPFDRTQMRMNYGLTDQYGFDLSVMGDITKFESDRLSDESNENSVRSLLQLSASYPIRHPGWFVVPKVQMLTRYYDFDADIVLESMADNPLLTSDRTTRNRSITLPTFSLDTGLIFERKANLFGTEYVQTLEPRALYTYTPYRDQSMLPLYDTGSYDYNLATLYLDNPYSGYDRIADVNMMTVGVGTRWQNPQTGVEALSLNLAQRLRFANQRVTLDDEPITSRYSDVLLSASTELVHNWRFDALVQYDTDENRSQRSLLMARWKPGQYRVMNFGYRMMHGFSEQVDFSWQWPIGSPWFGSRLPEPSSSGGRWYTVGRINYSLRDSKLVDGILGFEYQSCCWIARVAAERISTGRTEVNTRLSFQLEFTGLSRVGVNPLKTLQDNINHYETIRNERVSRPNGFYLYE